MATPTSTSRTFSASAHSVAEQHAEPHSPDWHSHALPKPREVFSRTILNIGFLIGMGLAISCFAVASLYLYKYLNGVDSLFSELTKASMQNSIRVDVLDLLIHGKLVAARFSLLSCGILTGLALCFIGFCLFLIGAKGEITAQGEAQHTKLMLSRLAPGAFVMFCATVLIAVCATHAVSFDTRLGNSPPQSGDQGLDGRPSYQLPSEKTDPKP